MTQVLSNNSSFSIDNDGKYYFVGGGTAGAYGITIKESYNKYFNYICNLLNSNIINWYVKTSSTPFQDDYVAFGKRFLDPVPLKIDNLTEATLNDVDSRVFDLTTLNQTKLLLKKLWRKTSNVMKNEDRKLFDILKEDSSNIRYNENLNENWFSELTFLIEYTNKNDLLSREFEDIVISANSKNKSIIFFGITEYREDVKIYEMKTNNDLILQHIYFSLLDLSDSNNRLKTFNEILEKTIIPIIKPIPSYNTPTIINKINLEVKDIQKSNSGSNDVISGNINIVEIEEKIIENEIYLDAKTCKLYGLTNSDIITIMDSIKCPILYQDKLLSCFNRIN
jgi:hypothetical protein